MSPYLKISKLVRFLIWGKAFQLLCWFYKCFFLTCIMVMDSKAKIICSLFTFIPSFCFYILDKPNTETGFKNGMVTFIIDFYPMCLNEWYALYLWEFSVWVFLVYWTPGTLEIAQGSQELNQHDLLVFPSYRMTCIILLYLVHAFILWDCREA